MCGVTGAVCIYMEKIMEAKGLREMNSDILKHIQITKEEVLVVLRHMKVDNSLCLTKCFEGHCGKIGKKL